MSLLGPQVKVVLMAGGRGERFWPKSTRARPKQFLRILGDKTLLRQAYERAAALVDPGSIYVVTGRDYEAITCRELPELPPEQVIVEPEGRNTAPALGLATIWLQGAAADPIMVALPSDHRIAGDEAFQGALLTAVQAAEAGYLVTVGIRPTRPETGYGYIQLGEPLAVHGGAPVHRAAAFTEKPDADTARAYCAGGAHLWNSGMVVARVSVLRSEIERHLPALHQVLTEIAGRAPAMREQVEARFAGAPSVSFDYGVLERSDRVATVPATFAWDDVGDWAALGRLIPADQQGNATAGDVLLHDCQGLVVDASGDRLVVAVGVADLVIVDTPQAVLVCRKDRAQDVRHVAESGARLVDAIQQRQAPI